MSIIEEVPVFTSLGAGGDNTAEHMESSALSVVNELRMETVQLKDQLKQKDIDIFVLGSRLKDIEKFLQDETETSKSLLNENVQLKEHLNQLKNINKVDIHLPQKTKKISPPPTTTPSSVTSTSPNPTNGPKRSAPTAVDTQKQQTKKPRVIPSTGSLNSTQIPKKPLASTSTVVNVPKVTSVTGKPKPAPVSEPNPLRSAHKPVTSTNPTTATSPTASIHTATKTTKPTKPPTKPHPTNTHSTTTPTPTATTHATTQTKKNVQKSNTRTTLPSKSSSRVVTTLKDTRQRTKQPVSKSSTAKNNTDTKDNAENLSKIESKISQVSVHEDVTQTSEQSIDICENTQEKDHTSIQSTVVRDDTRPCEPEHELNCDDTHQCEPEHEHEHEHERENEHERQVEHERESIVVVQAVVTTGGNESDSKPKADGGVQGPTHPSTTVTDTETNDMETVTEESLEMTEKKQSESKITEHSELPQHQHEKDVGTLQQCTHQIGEDGVGVTSADQKYLTTQLSSVLSPLTPNVSMDVTQSTTNTENDMSHNPAPSSSDGKTSHSDILSVSERVFDMGVVMGTTDGVGDDSNIQVTSLPFPFEGQSYTTPFTLSPLHSPPITMPRLSLATSSSATPKKSEVLDTQTQPIGIDTPKLVFKTAYQTQSLADDSGTEFSFCTPDFERAVDKETKPTIPMSTTTQVESCTTSSLEHTSAPLTSTVPVNDSLEPSPSLSPSRTNGDVLLDRPSTPHPPLAHSTMGQTDLSMSPVVPDTSPTMFVLGTLSLKHCSTSNDDLLQSPFVGGEGGKGRQSTFHRDSDSDNMTQIEPLRRLEALRDDMEIEEGEDVDIQALSHDTTHKR